MTDKTFTDEEIVKALEYCSAFDLDREILCADCPLFGRCHKEPNLLEREAFALINRQQAEIEALTINMNAYGLTAKRLVEEKQRLETQLEGTKAILQIVAPEWFGEWFRGVLYFLYQNVEEKGGEIA